MLLLQVEVLGLPPTEFLDAGQRTMDFFDGDDKPHTKVFDEKAYIYSCWINLNY
jgi:hypothetical protein